ncbi:MAG: diaminopimelate decarboxylase [Coriobacteriales bacterium]
MSHYERAAIEPDQLTVSDLMGVAPVTTKVEDGVVSIGGVPLKSIIEEYGTALFVYDEATLRLQLSSYLSEFRSRYPESDIIYAAKSFCCVAMDKIVAQEGVGIDVASGGELAIAQAAGFPMDRVFVQGNNKTPLEIDEAIDAGVSCFVVDTHEELERINLAARARDIKQKVILRICPGVEADTLDYIMTANEDSKFGFNIKSGAARAATEFALEHTHLEMAGFHMHIGSQIFDLSCWPVAIKVMFEFMDEMRRELGYTAQIFDLGGGLGIPYLNGDEPSSIAQLAEVITSAVKECAEALSYPLPHIYVEPGRSISANAGVTLYTVGSVKENGGITYVAVDGGMTDNIRTALYDSAYEAFVIEEACQPRSMVCDIVGKHCESGDVVVRNRSLQPCTAGQHVCVLATGAYCNEMASNYNKQVRPGIVMVKDGTARLVVRRETYADLIARDVI